MAKKKSRKSLAKPQEQPPRKVKTIRRNYAAASGGRLFSDWITSDASANSELYRDLRVLRARCRWLADNDAYAGGAIKTLLSNVLGESGFNYQSRVPRQRGEGLADSLNRLIEENFKLWSQAQNADIRGLCNFEQMARQVMRSWLIDGEVLVRIARKAYGARNKIPYALKVLEADYLVDDHEIIPKNKKYRVEMGIQFDQDDRIVGYWLYKGHPGDRIGIGVDKAAIEFVPASELMHLFFRDRPGQFRGVPVLAIAAKRLKFLADTEEAELVAAKLAAMIAGFVESENIDSFADPLPQKDGCCDDIEKYAQEPAIRSIEPGTVEHLLPGEKFSGFAPTRPNAALPDFTRHILRGISAAINLGYSSVSHDYSNASYSSHRAEKLAEIRCTRYLQHELKNQFHIPVSLAVLDAAWLRNLIELPGYETREAAYSRQEWLCPGFDWIDPSKDIQASLAAIEGNLSTLQIELGKRNLDWLEVLAQRAKEKEILESYGLSEEEAIAGDQGPQIQEGLTQIRAHFEGIIDQIRRDYELEIKSLISDYQSGAELSRVAIAGFEALADRSDPADPFPTPALTVVRPEISRAKNCKKGKPCGGSCQSKSNVCFVGLSADQKKLAMKARRAMKKGEGGVASELPGESESATSGAGGSGSAPPKIAAAQAEADQFRAEAASLEPDRQKAKDDLKASGLPEEFSNASKAVDDAQAEYSRLVKAYNAEGITDAQQSAMREEVEAGFKNYQDALIESGRVERQLIEAQRPLTAIEHQIDQATLQAERLEGRIARSSNDDQAFSRSGDIANTLDRPSSEGAIGRINPREVSPDNDEEILLSIDVAELAKPRERIRQSALTSFTGDDGKGHTIEFEVSGDSRLPDFSSASVESLEFLRDNWNGKQASAAFQIDGSFADVKLTRREKITATRKTKDLWEEEILPNLEPGTLVNNDPVKGQGGKRDQFYQGQGFGRVQSGGTQYSIVGNNGQLIPIDLIPTRKYLFNKK